MPIFTITHERLPESSLRFLESDVVLNAGAFFRLQDKDPMYQGDFMVIEVVQPEPGWATPQKYIRLVVAPMHVQEGNLRLCNLVAKIEN